MGFFAPSPMWVPISLPVTLSVVNHPTSPPPPSDITTASRMGSIGGFVTCPCFFSLFAQLFPKDFFLEKANRKRHQKQQQRPPPNIAVMESWSCCRCISYFSSCISCGLACWRVLEDKKPHMLQLEARKREISTISRKNIRMFVETMKWGSLK